jgi:DNA helicase IV
LHRFQPTTFRKKREGDGDTVSLNEMALTENGGGHKKLSDWRNKLASKFKKSVGEQVGFLFFFNGTSTG